MRLVLVVAFSVVAFSARAQPPAVGTTDHIVAIACDTKEEVLSLFGAAKEENGQGILPVYKVLKAKKNDKGEPTCQESHMTAKIDAIVDLGDAFTIDGRRMRAWALEVEADGEHGWALYGEEPEITQRVFPPRDTQSYPLRSTLATLSAG